jgi:hypothetical protein
MVQFTEHRLPPFAGFGRRDANGSLQKLCGGMSNVGFKHRVTPG